MNSLYAAHRILHPLNVRIDDAEKFTEIKDKILDLQVSSNELEPYFTRIDVYNSYVDFNTSEERWKVNHLNGFWTTKAIDQIKAIDGVEADFVRVGKKPMTLEDALAEVEAAVHSVEEEHERQNAIVEQYDKTRSHFIALEEYGYKNVFRMMKSQADFDRQIVLEGIKDELHRIGDHLAKISSKM